MPRLGTGLSLGAINKIPGFDFDVSNYIINNNITNSKLIYNLDGKNSLRLIASSSQSLSRSHDASFNITGNWSINFWMCADPLSLSNSGNHCLFTKGAFQNSGWYLQIQNSTLRFNTNSSGVNSTAGHTFYYLNSPPNSDFRYKWFMVTITYNYSTTLTSFYRDGVLLGTDNLPNPSATSSGNFWIGRDDNGNFYTGTIDEAGIWNKVLTQSEITELYNSGNGLVYENLSTGLSSNLQNWWSLDETTGTRNDSKGSMHLTANNTPGSGVAFCGKEEYVNPQSQLNSFVVGLKNLNFWDNCLFWPFRSIHNKGTGTSVSSLGGLGSYPATLYNGASWSHKGIYTTATNKYIGGVGNFGLNLATGTYNIFSLHQTEGYSSDSGVHGYNYLWSRTSPSYSPSYRIGPNTSQFLAFYADSAGTSSLQISPTDSNIKFRTIAIAKNAQSTIQTAFDRGAYTSTYNISGLSFFGSTHGIDFGNNGSYVANGVRSLEFIRTGSTLTEAQNQSLYDLVKSTIGYGLGLS